MARTNYFKGKSITDIMNMDISEFLSLEKPQLRQAVSRLADAANKRIKRLEEKEIFTPALFEIRHSGGKLSTKGKDLMQLRSEFMRATGFLKNEYSTVKGASGLMSDVQRNLLKYGISADLEDVQNLTKLYVQLEEKDPAMRARILKSHVNGEKLNLYISNTDKSTDEIIDNVMNAINSVLEPGGMGYDGISSFFEYEEDL